MPWFVSSRSRVLLGLGLVGFVCFWMLRLSGAPELHSTVPVVTVPEELPVATTTPVEIIPVGPILEAARPVSLEIPALSLSVPFSAPLGLAASGEIAVPEDYDSVGWYEYSPTPGELGPAVVLGHVDSVSGPAVFFSLGQLQPGDEITITREDGSRARFAVEALERYEQSDFPTEKVYGNIDHAGLRLITCSGIFERGAARYTHNLVVYARLLPEA